MAVALLGTVGNAEVEESERLRASLLSMENSEATREPITSEFIASSRFIGSLSV